MYIVPVARQYLFGHLTSTLEQMNVDVERVLARNGIPDWRYLGVNDLIPLVHFIRAFEAGARATGEERFSLMVAKANGLDHFADFGDAIQSGMSVHDAMKIACRLCSKQATTISLWLSHAKNGVLFCRKQSVAAPELSPSLIQLERYTLSLLVSIVRAGAGGNWSPPWMCMSVPKDTTFLEWNEFENTTVKFETQFTGIFVPNQVLSRPLRDNRTDVSAAGEIAMKRMLQDPTGQDFVHDLRKLVTSLLSEKSANLDTVSDVTMISRRTLQRRLSTEGITFKQILDQARYESARSLLDQDKMSVSEASETVGYEHPQHFIRAFRRWAGVTPAMYQTAQASNQLNPH